MNKNTYYGEFNAEKYWRNENLAKLPEIPDKQAENIVKAMDELLFTLCSEEDTLITRYKVNTLQKEYLKEVGFSFKSIHVNSYEDDTKETKNGSICELLLKKSNDPIINNGISKDSTLSAFAVLPESEQVAKTYDLVFDSPDISVIKKVNSKIYSSELNKNLNYKYPLKIVSSSEELFKEGKKSLHNSTIILKDSFGVSGKGNLVISNEAILKRIVSYIKLQEKSGKEVEFIIEPFLDKTEDFSCQFFIDKSGGMKILSIQKVSNLGSSYLGSYTPSEGFIEYIREKGYFSIIEKVSKQLYEDGYYGDVCIDSMILMNGDIVPVVEINARKSMSLIKHNIDKYASKFNLNCGFTFLNINFSSSISYEKLIKDMDNSSLLFKPALDKGLIPLSPNAMFINQYLDVDKKLTNYKGRFYLAILYKDDKEKVDMFNKITEILNKNQINVLS